MDSQYGRCPCRQRGFPIRKSTDIMRICRSPWLIAACRVLHRLSVTRHSPCALLSLTFYDGPGSLSFRKNLNREKSFQFNCNKLCVIKSHRLLAFLIHIKMFRVIQFSRYKPQSCVGSKNRGGDEGDRTPYPLLARQVLSQMSYTPVFRSCGLGPPRSLPGVAEDVMAFEG